MDSGLIDALIAEAKLQVNVTAWGALADLGINFLTAHLAASSPSYTGGTAATVASETAGPVSRSYDTGGAASTAGGYGSTRYGVEFQNLKRQLAFGYRVI